MLADIFCYLFLSPHESHVITSINAGATLACGTGAYAVVVAAVIEGHTGRTGRRFMLELRRIKNSVYIHLLSALLMLMNKSLSDNWYTMNEKVPPTASNRRKRELAREGDLVTYKRKRNTIEPSTVVPPNTADSAIEGISEGEGATSNDNVGPSDKSLLRSFRFHRARSIALGREKLLIRVHHHQSTWDLRKEPQVVQDFVKLKGLDRIGAISYNYYNSALISASVERWQPETNSFHFKWGEMTPILDDMEQLVGLPADSDATVIGGTWEFPAILEVFKNNLLQDLNAFNSLKAGGAENSLSLKKLKEHYAYKLEKVFSDGTAAAAKKKKGLTTRSVARAYMLYVLGSFQFPTKKGIDVSARYLVLFSKDKVAKKWSWGSTVLAHMYYNLGLWIFAHFPKLGGIPKEMDSDAYEHYDSGIHQKKPASVNEHGDTPVHHSKDIVEQYDASHHEHSSLSPNINLNDQQITTLNDQLQSVSISYLLFEDKEMEFEANINLRETLKEKTSECDMFKETIEQMKAEIELKCVVDEQCALELADLPRQLDMKILECKNLEKNNTSLEAELRSKSGLEDYNQSLSVELNKKLVVLQSHQPVLDINLAKKYEDLLAAHEAVKKNLIAKEDFRQKLVNAEEMMKSLEANNSEWHKKLVNSEEMKKTLEVDNNEWKVWRQALKKALASEGMGDMGDPTFEELFEQNERYFIIA
ncbi:hypothetical protein GIB67_038231 [Kingdonia uniflora]|uniref:Aminotransferase-like plant mobile domain-containing protein n=1 Tax=Kingdonia uniflora TaxID=39325 RepID=A0A7J7NHK4_9MAGN|nr:hypothetical protein GIB67_038231 [Kingdonia uniflora]